jgi:hypothetical protein
VAKIGRTEGKINLPDYIRVLPILAFYAKVVNFVRYSGCIEKFLEAVLNLFQDARQELNMVGTYLPAMIILFLNKFKTAS